MFRPVDQGDDEDEPNRDAGRADDTGFDSAGDVDGATVDAPPRGPFEIDHDFIDGRDLPALGDCDGDGRLDIVLATRGVVLRQREDGSLDEPVAVFEHDEFGAEINEGIVVPEHRAGFADIDADGLPDLVAGRADIQVARGLGDCRFDEPEVLVAAPCANGLPPVQVSVVDVDRDGLSDLSIVCAGRDVEHFVYALNRGDGTFRRHIPEWAPFAPREHGVDAFCTLIDDLDGDGTPDAFFPSCAKTRPEALRPGFSGVPTARCRWSRISFLSTRHHAGTAAAK